MSETNLKNAKILIVDDKEANVRLLQRFLGPAGYVNLKSIMDSRTVLDVYLEFQPDLILLDLQMPHLDGLAVMALLKPIIPADAYLPILVLTADVLAETKQKALSSGAKDFLVKPFDKTEVLLRIHNLLETRFLYIELHHYSETLETKVRERTRQLEEAQGEMLERLALASESRDDDTGKHTRRVGELSAALARAAGVPEERCALIRHAATLHDIGKIGIPDGILLKPGRLTPEEFEHMKIHTKIGAGILGGSHIPLLQLAEEIALYHHEKWDGTGYYGLAGEAIPLPARIVTVADVFDVLTHSRPYKEAWTVEAALEEIEKQKGRMFDPQLVELFLRDRWRSDLLSLSEAMDKAVQVSTEDVACRRR
ncbi:MAG: HD domain-containing phosphohydrolase [Bryobacteraceae bacterium]|jgi:putative two-component system response regulator